MEAEVMEECCLLRIVQPALFFIFIILFFCFERQGFSVYLAVLELTL